MRCLDCGNKAKKDCFYFRCRSCCRGHGFECQTHVKSTWVPISTRQIVRNTAATMVASSSAPPHHDHHQQEEQQQYDHPSSSGFGEHFPAEVIGEATFTRMRVLSNVEAKAVVEQYGYQTSINVRGHVFKGILYDQGPSRPMVNSGDMNVHDGGQQISTINVHSSNFHSANNPRPSSVSSIPPGYSPST